MEEDTGVAILMSYGLGQWWKTYIKHGTEGCWHQRKLHKVHHHWFRV